MLSRKSRCSGVPPIGRTRLLCGHGVGGVIEATATYFVRTHIARRQAAQATIMEILEALDAAEKGFHRPPRPEYGDLHTWAGGLPNAWKSMERAGILTMRPPKGRRYRELRGLLTPLAQIRPTVEQTSKMHLLEDRHSPAAHTGLWKDVMPSDETIERIVTGTVVIREHASKPL